MSLISGDDKVLKINRTRVEYEIPGSVWKGIP